jgi:tetratricopeptide (TPR) repeat protein
VYASTTTNFDESYLAIAKQLEIDGWNDLNTNVRELVVNHLKKKSKRQWLMIVDNADDYYSFFPPSQGEMPKRGNQSHLASYLPQTDAAGGRIIITTRDKRLGQQLSDGLPIFVESLPIAEAKTLLLAKIQVQAKLNNTEAGRLATTLDCHPLAITQSTAFINQNDDTTITDYINSLDESAATMIETLSDDLYDARRAPETPNAIFKTWVISYSLLKRRHDAAAELLCLMATLDNTTIPSRMLRNQDKVTLEDRKKIQTLIDFSLIRGTMVDDNFSMHLLVQSSTRSWMASNGTITHWQSKALELISNFYPKCGMVEESRETRDVASSLLPQANYVCAFDRGHGEKLGALLYRVALYECDVGKIQAALFHVQESLDIARKECVLPSELLERESFTAILLMGTGDTIIAAEMQLAALRKSEKYGKNSPIWFLCLKRYAAVLHTQCRYFEAETALREALLASTRIRGELHGDTFRCANNLAGCLMLFNGLSKTEELHREMLEKTVGVYGMNSRLTLQSKTFLLDVLVVKANYTEAEELARGAFLVGQKLLGQKHPLTLHFESRLAFLVRRQGPSRFADLVELYRNVLETTTKVFGPDSITALHAKRRLAALLYYLEVFPEATALNKEVLFAYESTRGRLDDEVLTILQSLALCLYKQAEIECLEVQKVLELRYQEMYGEEDIFSDVRRETLRIDIRYQNWTEEFKAREEGVEWETITSENSYQDFDELGLEIDFAGFNAVWDDEVSLQFHPYSGVRKMASMRWYMATFLADGDALVKFKATLYDRGFTEEEESLGSLQSWENSRHTVRGKPFLNSEQS